MKGCIIFVVDGFVLFGKVWCIGVNFVIKIIIGQDVKMGGVEVVVGSYVVFIKLIVKEWIFMLYLYESGSWGSYVEKEFVVIFSVVIKKIGMMVELFIIGVNNLISNSVIIDFMWENIMVSVLVEVEVYEQVMFVIKCIMVGFFSNDYFCVVSYMYDSGIDFVIVLEYIQKVNDIEELCFWMVCCEVFILVDFDCKQEVIVVVKCLLVLVKEVGNDDYVCMNEKFIVEWGQ